LQLCDRKAKEEVLSTQSAHSHGAKISQKCLMLVTMNYVEVGKEESEKLKVVQKALTYSLVHD